MAHKSLNNKIKINESYTFDDLLLIPGYSDFTRDQTDLTVQLHPTIRLPLGIISSPMDRVTMAPMAISLARNGGLGIIHRNLAIHVQAKEVEKVKTSSGGELENTAVDSHGRLLVGAAVGLGSDLEERVKALAEVGVDILVLDAAHGHTKAMAEATKWIKDNFFKIPLVCGNITTASAAEFLIKAGADILKVGMGPGSICTTRIVSGMGMPQLTALDEVLSISKNHQVKVIADGGIKQIGDIAKAFAVGADAVMLGSLLAGFDESPSEIVEIENKKYKSYRGMGSIGAMTEGSNTRYGQGIDPKKMVAEGVEALVPYKGSVENFLGQIKGGLRSSLFYTGCKNLSELSQKAQFVKISNSGLKESHPHSILITEKGQSYL